MKRISFNLSSLFVLLLLLLFAAQPALARVLVDGAGNVIIAQGQVLGDDDEKDEDDDNSGSGSSDDSEDDEDESDDEDDDNSGSGSSGSSSNSSDDSDDDKDEADEEDDGEDEVEYETADGTKVKTEIRGNESQTEIEYADGTKVKTETRDGRTRTDVYQNGVKVRLERDGDRFRIKAEDENGEEVELGEDEIISIDERADRDQIRIRTFNTLTDQTRNRAIIERLSTQALTDLPLSVNLETNELTVTTAAGEKTVTVLPDQAVQNMLAANVIDRIGGQQLASIVQEGGVETLEQVIELSEDEGVPVYEIAGVKEHKLLGLFKVTTDVEVVVSAETGEVVDTNQSFFDTLIDVLSTDS